ALGRLHRPDRFGSGIPPCFLALLRPGVSALRLAPGGHRIRVHEHQGRPESNDAGHDPDDDTHLRHGSHKSGPERAVRSHHVIYPPVYSLCDDESLGRAAGIVGVRGHYAVVDRVHLSYHGGRGESLPHRYSDDRQTAEDWRDYPLVEGRPGREFLDKGRESL
ncbi:uncharacterized protein METZ01_LOCUS402353, partial [marine metagenome]